MIRRARLTKPVAAGFIMANVDLARRALDERDPSAARALIAAARKDLGFSPKTVSVDIESSLRRWWRRLANSR